MHTAVASTPPLPLIIQGGMGVGVSCWSLARAVALAGQMGVVSGTAVDSLLVRRLQDGDVGGHIRRAFKAFPMAGVADDILKRFFLPEGRAPGRPYKILPTYRQVVSKWRDRVTILGAFTEVFLAKEGHRGPIGINLLTKIQMPTLATLYGAMLAGVDYVLMGAGIPKDIPGALDALAEHRAAAIRFDVEDLPAGESEQLRFEPMQHWDSEPPPLYRPRFLPIISSDSLAVMLARKANGRVDGFVIEGPTAGGHNAPPRGGVADLNERGEPVYGERDVPNLKKIADLGLPFWLAGGTGSPEGLRDALAAGATGIQVGTLFAYCEESGLSPELRQRVLEQARAGKVDVRTDPVASPTGFPFKVVNVPGSLAHEEVYAARDRICDLGYLRVAFRTDAGQLDYRCAAEPVDAYVKKGGSAEEAAGRRCLCNALLADIGFGQLRSNGVAESPLLTGGDDLCKIGRFVGDRSSYHAADVVEYLLSGIAGQAVDEPARLAAAAPGCG